MLLCVAGAVTAAIWAPATGRMPRAVLVAIGIVLIGLTVGALAGASPLPQLLGRAPRYEGIIGWSALIAAAAVAARVLGPNARPEAKRHAVAVLVTCSVLLCAVSLLELTGLRPLESDLARPGSLAGNATDQGILGAAYAAVLGAIAIGRWRRGEKASVWLVVGAICGAVSVATSASRAGLLALSVVVVVLTVRALTGAVRRRRTVLIVVAAIAVIAGTVLLVPLTRARVLGLSGFARQTIEDRLIMWGDAWSLFLTSPVLGVGPNGFADAITTQFGDGWFDRAGIGAILDSPHNAIVQAFVVGGLVAAIPAIALAVVVAIAAVRGFTTAAAPRRDALVGAMTAVAAAGVALLTHVTSPKTLVLLAALVGVMVAITPRPIADDGARRRRGRILATVVAGVWVAALAAMTIADAWLLGGRFAVARGDLPAASSAFARAAALRPWDPDIALVAAESFGAAVQNGLAGALDDGRLWANRAVEALPTSSRAQYVAGIAATLARDEAAAVDHLGRAAALSPADPRIAHEYGVAAFLAGDASTARVVLERAAMLAPETSSTWAVLADVCDQLGDRDCADEAESRVAALRAESGEE